MSKLVISIINFKTRELTSRCLESIFSKKWKTDFEVWLVDNASNDGSGEYLKNKFPQIKLIKSDKNLGFAGGHNLVLKKINSQYVLILNSDVEVSDKVIDKMVEFINEHTEVRVASCKVLGFDGKLQPNGGDLPFGMALLSWLFNLEVLGIKSNFHRNDGEYYQSAHEVGWVSGNFMMVRGEVFKKVGFLSDKFFMYFEDAEFCYRVKKAGYKIMINPKVSIKHLSGGSLDNPKLKQWTGEFKGLLIFYQQFGLSSVLINVLVFLAAFLRMIVFAISGKMDYALNYGKIITNL